MRSPSCIMIIPGGTDARRNFRALHRHILATIPLYLLEMAGKHQRDERYIHSVHALAKCLDTRGPRTATLGLLKKKFNLLTRA